MRPAVTENKGGKFKAFRKKKNLLSRIAENCPNILSPFHFSFHSSLRGGRGATAQLTTCCTVTERGCDKGKKCEKLWDIIRGEGNFDFGRKQEQGEEKPDSPGNIGRAAFMSTCADLKGSRYFAHRSPVCLCKHICEDPSLDAKLQPFFAAV